MEAVVVWWSQVDLCSMLERLLLVQMKFCSFCLYLLIARMQYNVSNTLLKNKPLYLWLFPTVLSFKKKKRCKQLHSCDKWPHAQFCEKWVMGGEQRGGRIPADLVQTSALQFCWGIRLCGVGGNWAASGGNGKLRKQHLLFLLFHTDLPVTRLGVKVLLLLQNMGNVVFFLTKPTSS